MAESYVEKLLLEYRLFEKMKNLVPLSMFSILKPPKINAFKNGF
ncbi:hypothetical protein RV17_GL001065 [Enterococcus thailandicus]|nr:hypothetical protein RV17_GL001065 [Enterococcus thailandicus]